MREGRAAETGAKGSQGLGKVGPAGLRLGQLLEMGSGLVGGLPEPSSPPHPHAVLVPVQPDAALVLEPIANWLLSLHLQKQKSCTRREF